MNTTFPGFCSIEVAGEPPGKTQEYLAALEVVLKETPAGFVTEPLEVDDEGGEGGHDDEA